MSLDGIQTKLIYFKYQNFFKIDRFAQIEDFDHEVDILFIIWMLKDQKLNFNFILSQKWKINQWMMPIFLIDLEKII